MMSERLNYVDMDFLQKELKGNHENQEESHYAEVVRLDKPDNKQQITTTFSDENVYRLKSEFKNEKTKIHAKIGDLFLSKEKPKYGLIDGTLLQVAARNNYHPNVSIPVDKLVAYTPAKQSLQPSTPTPVYEDMSDIKSSNDEFDVLAKFFQDFPVKMPPTIPLPSMEKSKSLTKQKLSKLRGECKIEEDEVAIFAVGERKSGSKEKGVLTYRRKQLAVLLFSSASGWWLIRMFDGTTTTIGWVPGNHWRIMPVNLNDDHSSNGYRPWLALDVDKTEMKHKLQATGSDRDFIFVYDNDGKDYILLVKKQDEVYNFTVSIVSAKRLMFSKHDFQTLDNVVLYLKRKPLKFNTSSFTLGRPFTSA